MHWPKSEPDYQWPSRYASIWMAPVRSMLAVAFHTGYAVGLLASLIRRGHTPVLVIRTDGIGDAVLFEPALETLAQKMSPHPIHLWAPKWTLDIMRAVPVIDRRFAIPRGFKHGNLAYFRSPLWRVRMGFRMGMCVYDKVIYPAESPEPLGNWLFSSVRAVERWINYGDTDNQFQWQRQRAQEVATFVIEKRPGSAHELLRNAYLVTQWSGKLAVRKPRVHLTDKTRKRADEQISAWRKRGKSLEARELVGIVACANSSVNTYPVARWAHVIRLLWTERKALAVLLGGPEDRVALHHLSQVLSAVGVPWVRLDKPVSILESAALLARLDGVISVDTGLAHLAVAQGVPSVVLSGGGQPGRFFPWPRVAQHAVLNVRMPCEGCRNRCVQSEARCVTGILPEDILAAYASVKTSKTPLQLFPTWTTPLAATG